MPFKGGVEQAAKMLAGLDPQDQERILKQIAQKDPKMAEVLRDGMVVMEDLVYLTVQMIRELLQEIQLSDLGLALRICSPDLKDHLTKPISKNMREEINDVLNGKPQALTTVNEATARIMKVVKDKISKGQIVLNKDNNDEYV